MKIKTFEFLVSCYRGNYVYQDRYENDSLKIVKERCKSSEDIDKIINNYMIEKDVVSVNENFYTLNRHNNGGYDTVIRSITIITK